jgi:hypothetical protein
MECLGGVMVLKKNATVRYKCRGVLHLLKMIHYPQVLSYFNSVIFTNILFTVIICVFALLQISYTQRRHNLDFQVVTLAISISPRWSFPVVT